MRVATYIMILLFFIGCKGQQLTNAQTPQTKDSNQHKDLEQTISQILKFYNDKNQKELSRFINPEIGLYFLYRPGTVDYWQKTDKICFDSECLKDSNTSEWGKEALKNQKLQLDYKLQHTKEEIIGCESVLKNGLFEEDSDKARHLLSEIMKKYAVAFKSDLPSQDLAKLKLEEEKVQQWENNSKRIVLAQKKDKVSKGEAFVFYLTKINGKWYLTIIDHISFDCSV